MPNKHTKMFKPWIEDNILSTWNKKKISEVKYVYEKVKHIKAHRDERLGREWEHERIWND